MSESLIVRRGGVNKDLFAIISVTYPAGSTCTCSDGTTTLTAKDTSGYALFNVKAGTYTVECHTSDNSKSKSTSVTVTESDMGKTKSVTLSYDVTYIFKSGVGFSSGCYAHRLTENGDFSRKDYLVWATSRQLDYGNVFQFTPAIDMSKFNTIYIELACTSRYNSSGAYRPTLAATAKFRVDESVSTWSSLQKYAIAQGTYNTSRYVLSLDISSVSSSAYILFAATGLSGNIYNVWLE